MTIDVKITITNSGTFTSMRVHRIEIVDLGCEDVSLDFTNEGLAAALDAASAMNAAVGKRRFRVMRNGGWAD